MGHAGEYRDVLDDRYPPPGVWRQVDEAAHSAAALWSEGRELDFEVVRPGQVNVSLVEAGLPSRPLSLLETLAVAAGVSP